MQDTLRINSRESSPRGRSPARLRVAVMLLVPALLLTACPTDGEPVADDEPGLEPGEPTEETEEPADAPAPTGRAGTLVIAKDMSSDVTMDPARTFEELAWTLLVGNNVYEHLVAWESTADGYDYESVVGLLAESWESSDDATVWTFEMDPDATFASGNPITSEDVKWSFERLQNLEGPPAYLADNIESIDAPDPETVVFNLGSPDASFPALLTANNLVVLDSELLEQNGGTNAPDAAETDTAEEWLSTNSAGSGPYRIESHQTGERMVLQRVDDWWRGETPAFEQVIITNIPDPAARVAALERGDIDNSWTILPHQADALAQQGFEQLTSDILQWYYLVMTTDPAQNEFVANPEVQLALKHAVDWEELELLCPAGADRVHGLAPERIGGLPGGEGLTEDLEQAEALLAEAGYPDGGSLTLETFLWSGFCPVFGDIVQKLAADWGRIGVTVDVQIRDFDSFITDMRAGDVDAAVVDWFADYPSAANYASASLPGSAIAGRARWDENFPMFAELEALTQEMLAAPTVEDQLSVLNEAERLALEHGPIVPLLEIPTWYAYAPDLTGVVFHSQYRFEFARMGREAQ